MGRGEGQDFRDRNSRALEHRPHWGRGRSVAGEGGQVEGLGKGCDGASRWVTGPLLGCHGDCVGEKTRGQ